MTQDSKPVDEHVRLYGNPSIDYDISNNDLVMTWWVPDGSGNRAGVARVPVEDLIDFMQGVARTGGYALSNAIRDLFIGDCATCRNTRLVEVERPNGAPWNERCPECGPRYEVNQPLKQAPTVGPKIKPGFEPQSRRSGL